MNNTSIGILGGGQLGAMLIRHAVDMGVDISVMESSNDAPSAKYTRSFTKGDTKNFDDVYNFGKGLDIITIEKEAVNTEALKALQKEGVKVFPDPDTIELIKDKYTQKEFLNNNSIPVAKGRAVQGKEEIKNAINNYPICLKLRRDGYDGKGVMMLKSEADVETAFEAPSLIEELIDIKEEISVIVARNEHGEVICYDPTIMVFDPKLNLLDYQICPGTLPTKTVTTAKEFAAKIATDLQLVGILAVEMFITNAGEVVVNELAPRPHNSGHHTIEACLTSQYEQLLRAIRGLPLGNTKLTSDSVLVNLLEPEKNRKEKVDKELLELYKEDGVHIHLYGKINSHPGRKVGHITITSADVNKALEKAKNIRERIK